MKQKKVVKKLFHIVLLVFVLFLFYKVNELNYTKQKSIKENIVNHPESLPTNEVAKATSFGFKNVRADFYRLETIQYIGGNAISSQYKKYLFLILDLITELNPYFEHPYVIGLLLLPEYNERYEVLKDEEQKKYKDQAEQIGLKGIKNFCDLEKIKMIKQEEDLNKVWTEEKYSNPCKSYQIPFYLAYVYYFHRNDPINSSLYYKVSSANKDSLEGSKILSAIMQGKGGNREKSIFMFLTMARSVVDVKKESELMCLNFINSLEKISGINGELIKTIENDMKNLFGEFEEKKEKQFLDSNSCQNYANKAVREINLFYLDSANKKYFKDKGINALDSKTLYDKGYINYQPVDFQQYENYGIEYKFNEKTGFFDYEMGELRN